MGANLQEKEVWGFGVTNIKDFNTALLLKWCWKLFTNHPIRALLGLTSIGHNQCSCLIRILSCFQEEMMVKKIQLKWRKKKNLEKEADQAKDVAVNRAIDCTLGAVHNRIQRRPMC